jgi:hypothetical protein
LTQIDRPHNVVTVRFLAITLIVHTPDPDTGAIKPTSERFAEILDNARLAEELGFSHIAALTSRIRLFTAVTTLSLLDPVRAYDKVHRYHKELGHTVMHLHADAGWLPDAVHRASLELFTTDIAPVLHREIPDPPWPWDTPNDGADTH